MRTHSFLCGVHEDVESLVRSQAIVACGPTLIQVFLGVLDFELLSRLNRALKERYPDCIVIGASASSVICRGSAVEHAAVVIISSFREASIEKAAFRCDDLPPAALGAALASDVCGASTKAIITFGTHPAIVGDEYLEGLRRAAPEVVIAGGMASPPPESDRRFVFADDQLIESGIVAVGLSGKLLRAKHDYSMNWQSLSKALTVTSACKNLIKGLDGKPAAEAFRTYLDASDDQEIAFLGKNFPLLVRRGPTTLARGIMTVGADGALVANGSLLEGEQVRFGVADSAAMQAAAVALKERLLRNPPQAIYCYSCVGRLRFAKESVSRELECLTGAAPTSGFFGAGEFYGTAEQTTYHNFTLTALSLTEDIDTTRPARSSPMTEATTLPMSVDALRFKALHHLARVTAQELEAVNTALKHQAISDPLTGAYNRRGFMERFAAEAEQQNRRGGHMVFALLDIDHFKRVNDEHGHRCGDVALQQMVAAAQRCLDANDILGRVGGEEFCILMPGSSSVDAISRLDRLRLEISRLGRWCSHPASSRLTVSVGATTCASNEEWDAVYSRADSAMYRAKAAGRDRVVPDFGPSLEDGSSRA